MRECFEPQFEAMDRAELAQLQLERLQQTLLRVGRNVPLYRKRFAEHDIRLPDGVLVRATLSIGVADASHCPIEITLQRADFALYEAKRLGRNRVIVAEEGL